MKSTKFISIVVVLLLLVSIMASCGGSSDQPSVSDSSNGSDTSDTVQETAQEEVSIEFYTWFDEEAYMTEIVEDFQDKFSHIKVNPVFVPTDEYAQKLLVSLSGGTDIDVFCISNPPGYAEYVNKDQVLPLDDLISTNGYDMFGIEDLAEQLRMNGSIYGLPYRTSAWVLYYNKDIFDQYNVDYPDETWTWEKYAEVAKELTQGEGEDKTWGSLNFSPTSSWWRVPANTAGYNDPLNPEHLEGFKQAAKLSYDLSYTFDAQQPYGDRVGSAGGDYTGVFLQGKTAMVFNGDWLVEMLNRNIEENDIQLNYDIAPIPYWEGQQPATTGSPAIVMISKNTQKEDAAFELVKFISSEDGASVIARNGLMPAWNSEPVNNLFLDNLEQPENARHFFTRPVNSQVPTDPLYNTAMGIVTEEVSLYLLQEKDLDETFEKIKQRLEDEID